MSEELAIKTNNIDKMDQLREDIDAYEKYLHNLVTVECPREHKAVQHRDGKEPWCKACGRTDRGVQVRVPKGRR